MYKFNKCPALKPSPVYCEKINQIIKDTNGDVNGGDENGENVMSGHLREEGWKVQRSFQRHSLRHLSEH